ncbi:hypothetical protein MKW92_003981 [Papaver armeniacum]|nr:hypothetical protein MKW92_003981 [Papaver armeniacum]
MSKISSSISKLKKRILSSSSSSENLFSTTNSARKTSPFFLTRTLTSNQSIFSNSSSIFLTKIHNPNFDSSHGGARNLSSLRKEVEVKKHQSSFSVDNRSTHNLKRKDLWTSIPVRAYCLSPRIDLIGLMSENQANLIPHTPGMSNYAVLRFANTNSLNPLRIIKRHASGLQKTCKDDGGDSLQHYIDYEVREKQDLPTWMQGGLNCMLLQQLDIDGMCTVGSILGQSVALDYYSLLVDQWVKEYLGVNYGLEKKGQSDIAWKGDTKYAQMLDYLRDEFQLTQRFAGLDRKFKMGR